MKEILIVDDDLEIQSIIKSYLEREGFSVLCADSSAQGFSLYNNASTKLIILDIFLPDGNGMELCKYLRTTSKIPIIMISAKGDESDKVLGLGLGADDFLTKPFSINELVARVKAQIRRNEYIDASNGSSNQNTSTLIAGPIIINAESRLAYCNDKPLSLRTKEFDLLSFFVKNVDRVFSKENLYEKLWGYDFNGDTRTVMVHIRRLREKIEINPNDPKILLTVWGVGYKFTTHI